MAASPGDRLEAFTEGFVRLNDRLSVGALHGVVLYPGLASLAYLLQTTGDSLSGRASSSIDFLDAGARQPIALLLFRLLVVMVLIPWLFQRRRVHPGTGPAVALAELLALVVAASAAHSRLPGDAWPATLTLWLCLALLVVALDLCRRAEVRRSLGVLLALSGAMAGWCGLALFRQAGLEEQMTGAFFQPNVLAVYMAMTLPMTLALWAQARGRWPWVYAFFFVGQGAALMLSVSRAGWATGLLVTGAMGVVASTSRPPRFLLRVSLAVAAAWLVFSGLAAMVSPDHAWRVVPRLALQRAESSRQEDVDSGKARVAFFRAAMAIGREHPWLGVGPEGFNRYYPQHQSDFRWYSRYSHSLYLDWLAETGLPSLVTFVGLVAWLGWRGLQHARQGERLPRAAALLGMGASLLHAAVDVDWKFAAIPGTFFVLAALAASPPQDEKAEPVPASGPGIAQLGAAMLLLGCFGFSLRLWIADHNTSVATALIKAGRPAEAVGELEAAHRAFPQQAQVCEGLVDAWVLLYQKDHKPGQLTAAAHWAQEAARLDPHRSVSWSRVGEVALLQNQPQAADAAYRQAVALDPVNFPEYWDHLASLAAAAGHEAEAVSDWQHATQPYPWPEVLETKSFRQDALRPQLVEAWTNLGNFRFAHNDLKAAVEAYRHVLEMDPHNAVGQIALASSYYGLKQPAEAIPLLLEAAREQPQSAPIQLLLGSCYEMQGKKTEARQAYRQALKLDPKLRRQVEAALHRP